MSKQLLFAILCLVFSLSVVADSPEKQANHKLGEFIGAKDAEHPDWFKESFLDLEEDIADAASVGKRLVVYFWQPGCPYCSQLWSDNFAEKDIENTFRENFEIVAINMWGDKDVVMIDGNDYSEKTFAEALSVSYTPTLFFFDENNKVVHKLAGYVPPKDFRLAIQYVSQHKEKQGNYARFISSLNTLKDKSKLAGKLHTEPFFMKSPYDLSKKEQSKKYRLALFEEPDCENCDLLHQKTFKDSNTRQLLKQFQTVQLHRHADTKVTTPKGKEITAQQWANDLNLSYLPAMVFFDDDGNEVMRIDTQMHSFHVQSVFDYVLSGSYKTEKNFQRYISVRSEEIREQGKDVDIWKY